MAKSNPWLTNFKKPTLEILKKVAKDIAKKEGFTITDDVADLLAFMGDGSFRDTIGILQKIIGSSADKKIELEIEDFIKKRYKAKNTVLEFEVNEKLLGGIKIQVGDEIIDTTLKNKIKKLENYLITQ